MELLLHIHIQHSYSTRALKYITLSCIVPEDGLEMCIATYGGARAEMDNIEPNYRRGYASTRALVGSYSHW